VKALHDYLFRERAIAATRLEGGVETPLRFSGARAEHSAVRRTAGLFDFSFMASVDIAGPDALPFVERVQVRRVRRMEPGRICYTLLCRDDGTVLNDATVWCRAGGRYTLFTGRRSDAAHLGRSAGSFDVSLEDRSLGRAVCAVQGPLALRALEAAFPGHDWKTLPYFGFRTVDLEGAPCDIGRLGYTGEAGFEAIVEAAAGARLWQRLASAGAPLGIAECGLEAADILRIEAGFILFARELAHRVTPFELRMGWMVSGPGATFAGARALEPMRWRTPRRCLAGVAIEGAGTAIAAGAGPDAVPPTRPGMAFLTSAATSPLFARRIGLAFVDAEDRHPGTLVRLQTGERARVARLPFYDLAKVRPRRDWAACRPNPVSRGNEAVSR